MFKFTALLGALSSSPASQSLLELDGGVKVLVDVGWDAGFDVEQLAELEKHIPTLSFILLTHATPAHIAAFAHCCKHFPLFTRIPVYATTPVINLGRALLQDAYASTPLASSVVPTATLSESGFNVTDDGSDNPNILLPSPTSEEIAGYFALINPLKYSQPHPPIPSPFSPPLNGLTITAYNAGHTLGGTIWHIQHGMESIVYAVDWNQAREHVLASAAWLGSGNGAEVIEQLRRPSALICSSRGAERVGLAGGNKRRDELLLELIEETIKQGGTVLIPSDSSARVLELAYLLEKTWHEKVDKENQQTYRHSRLFMTTRTAGSTMRYARSMLEWMEEGIVREFEAAAAQQSRNENNRNQNRGHRRQHSQNVEERGSATHSPFAFRHMKLFGRKHQIERMIAAPGAKVIVASDQSLEWGFSRDVLRAIAGDSKNLVILTERVAPIRGNKPGLGAALWELYESISGQGADAQPQGPIQVQQDMTIRIPRVQALEGNELALYQQYQARRRQLQTNSLPNGATALETSADVVDDASSVSSESSDEDDEHQGKLLNVSAAMTQSRNKLGLSDAELGVNILIRRKGVHDFDVQGRKGRDKTFPYAPKKKRNDEYGDLIRPEDYLRAEERDEVDGEDMRNGNTKQVAAVGEKRRWGDNNAAGGNLNGTGRKGKRNAFAQDADMSDGDESGSGSDGSDSSDSDSDDDTNKDAPAKVVFAEESLQLRLRIAYVDFAGLHDKRSLHMLIPLIRPRKLVLIGGQEAETLALAADARKLLASADDAADTKTEVFTPASGHTVDASVDTNAWTIKLSHRFAAKLKWQNVRGLGVVAITGVLKSSTPDPKAADGGEEDAGARKKQKILDTATDISSSNPAIDSAPTLDLLPPNLALTTKSHAPPLHVGDLRLADLRKILLAAGHTVEFRGEGTLLVDGAIVVRKSGMGRIEVEGGVQVIGQRRSMGSFYEVRRMIYESLAVVAGN